MNKTNVLAFLDAEIQRLQEARRILSGDHSSGNGNRGTLSRSFGGRRRRRMSAEAKRRISIAQKKRWALRKKAAA